MAWSSSSIRILPGQNTSSSNGGQFCNGYGCKSRGRVAILTRSAMTTAADPHRYASCPGPSPSHGHIRSYPRLASRTPWSFPGRPRNLPFSLSFYLPIPTHSPASPPSLLPPPPPELPSLPSKPHADPELTTQYSRLRPSLDLSSPSLLTALFLLSLLALEALFATYWACLKLYHLLPALAGLGLGAAWLGKNALRASNV